MTRTRIGLLGASGIAPQALIAPSRRRDDVTLAAVASRSDASEYAQRHGIDHVYASYQALIEDAEIDLVYIALPPSEHARWSIAAVEAGKDVLCEKPLAMNAAEASEVVAAATRCGHRVIEAFHDYYHPLFTWIQEFVSSGELGVPLTVTAEFAGTNVYDPTSIRHAPELGGGALMDMGCYPVHWVRTLFGEPTITGATAQLNPLGADFSMDAQMDFDRDVRGVVRASMLPGLALEASLHVVGSESTLHVDNVVFPSRGHSIVVERNGLEYISTVAGQETYDHQLAAVLHGLQTGQPLATEGQDSVNNMRVIDDIYRVAGIR